MNKRKTRDALSYVLITLLSLFIIYPFLWLIANSLKSGQDMAVNSLSLIPHVWYFSNYIDAIVIGGLGRTFLNSLIITIGSLAIILVVSYLGSYALARITFPGRNIILIVFVATMMLPIQILALPLFKFEAVLHISNTYIGMILPYTAGSLAFSIFILTAFIRKLPFDIEEAAFIDGASRLRTVWSIILPLSAPGFATIIVFDFMSIWNEFNLALILLQNPDLKTLPLALNNFTQNWGQTEYNKLFAALVIITVPVIVVYVIFQKQFINGLTQGSVKE
jgi:raffinose/stachyose/melibiose transport system permease protein